MGAFVSISLWDEKDKSFQGSGILLSRNHVLTATHVVRGAGAWIGLIDGVKELRLAEVVATHKRYDVAILKMAAQTPGEVQPPPLLAVHVDLAGEPITLHVVSPITHNRSPLDGYRVINYTDEYGEYEISPQVARGHSGGVVAWRGALAGLLFARGIDDPLTHAISMHRIAGWIAGHIPGVVLLHEPPAPVAAKGGGELSAVKTRVEVPSTGSARKPGKWVPMLRGKSIEATDCNPDRLLPLVRHVLQPNQDARPEDILRRLLADSVNAGEGSVLLVSGAQGSGKSVLLLYIYCEMRRRGEPVRKPVFVDLDRYHDRLFQCEDAKDVEIEMQKEFTELLDAGGPFVFLVDGIARDNPLQTRALQQLRLFLPASTVLMAVQDKLEAHLCQLLLGHGLPEPRDIVRLETMHPDHPAAGAFSADFIRAYRALTGDDDDPSVAEEAAELLERAQQLKFQALDTHLLAILYDKRVDDNYLRLKTKTDFLERYCLDQLMPRTRSARARKPSPSDEMTTAAKLAFEHLNQRYGELKRIGSHTDATRERVVYGLVREHQNVRDFLAAWYLLSLLRDSAADQNKRRILEQQDLLTIDIPETVSSHLKELINRDEKTRSDVLKTINATIQKVAPPTRQLMYYLVGRLHGSAKTTDTARALLRSAKSELMATLTQSGPESDCVEMLSMLRTVFVSLIYLGDADSSAEYIRHLIDLPRAASVNRGFHRIYYGDFTPVVGDGSRRYLDDDATQSWNRTKNALMDRLRQVVAPEQSAEDEDQAFDLRVLTLVSFVQSRLVADVPVNDLDDICTVLRQSLPRTASEDLKHFVNGFLIDVEQRTFSVWNFILDLYRLKKLPRQGWLKRGLPAAAELSAETVADHAYFCCLLAWFLLPEAGPEDRYDKRIVIEMLLMHDIAEAYIGDQITTALQPDQLRKYRLEELAAMGYVRSRQALHAAAGAALAFERWKEFDSGQASPHACIAKDFDRLENLIQAYLYEQHLAPVAFREFRDALVNAIETPLGKALAESFMRWVPADGLRLPSFSEQMERWGRIFATAHTAGTMPHAPAPERNAVSTALPDHVSDDSG